MQKRAIVTGVAGFIGSHLAEQLICLGYQVVGIDCFTGFYARQIKEANLHNLRCTPGFCLIERDILDLNWTEILIGTDYVFHLAAQAGVRTSWGNGFVEYTRNNVLATQRILEAVKELSTLKGMIFSSSSSIYGDAETFPTPEDTTPRPVSPYGVTKLACEHLCRMYHQSFGVPVAILRYFTAYGPRQRPDMAFHRFITAMNDEQPIIIYGDGEQSRDFTFVSDVVQANILAMQPAAIGQVFNIGGGSQIKVNQVIEILEALLRTKADVRRVDKQRGDARSTAADIAQAKSLLGYQPSVKLEDGLSQEIAWLATQWNQLAVERSSAIAQS